MNVETLVWVLTGALTVISALGGLIWKLLRDEAKELATQVSNKADKTELNAVKENSEKLVNKLEARHEKEMDQLASRLGDQIRNTETNILTQIRLMIEVLKTQQAH